MSEIVSLIPMEEIESGAVEQLNKLAEKDFIIKIAVMPDIHQGYEMPIGTVAEMDGVISSACVGYDIGCGMIHYPLDVGKNELNYEEIQQKILSEIPVGFNSHEHAFLWSIMPELHDNELHELSEQVNDRVKYQMGTLGGGNHFIEIGESVKTGKIGVTIHSGSRKVGHLIASYFNQQIEKGLPAGYFALDSIYGKLYTLFLYFADQFAYFNRLRMLTSIEKIIIGSSKNPGYLRKKIINESHNHALIKNDGSVLHRKGATIADSGVKGVIPINMRDGVYITEGLGNAEYLNSASHGAGRLMSRSKARKNLNYEHLQKNMEGIHSNLNEKMLDESPEAYKDADYVISAQEGVTVKILDHFKPLLVIKG